MSRKLHDWAPGTTSVQAARPPTIRRRLGQVGVVTLLVAAGACGKTNTTVTSDATTATPEAVDESAGPIVGPVRRKSYVGRLKPNPETAELGLPEPERAAVGEGQFLGAIKLERLSNATDEDRSVVHRLNSGLWVADTNEQFVDIDPMLDYGPVFDQTTDPPGAVGGTTLLAMHNITKPPPEITAVTIDGVTHSQSRMMVSTFNEHQLSLEFGTRKYRSNVSPGDKFEIILNNENRTTTVLTYEVDNVRDMPPAGPEFAALKDPPKDPTASRLVVYSCWEPGDDKLRQAAFAKLTSRVTRLGGVADPGPQPRRAAVLR